MYARIETRKPQIDFATLALCRGLGTQATSRFASISSVIRVAAGRTVFSEGDEVGCVYEVIRGMLRLSKLLPDGRRQIVGFISAGKLIGFAPSGVCRYTVESIADVTLCKYARAGFDRLIDEVPGLARRLLGFVSDELRAAQDQMLLLGRKDAVEKVATFLVMMAGQQGDDDDVEEVDMSMGRGDIADYLGLTPETVSRTLSQMKREGLIALPHPSRIVILDRSGLEDRAAGESEAGF